MSRTYEYDPNGNITSILDGIEPPGNETFESAGTYSYDAGTNILADVQGARNVVYDYDGNGNTISANTRTFIYDLSNRLINVQDSEVTVAQYAYNALNQRIKKILPTETRIFHYDLQGHLIAETNPSGAMLAEYFYLGDQVLAMVRPGEVAYYYHNDHLGTPQILTNDTGTVAWKAFYKPFGEAVISISTIENPFRFPGQYYDPEAGLHYNWNRYYDPKTGRYLTPDPIGLDGGINLFRYVHNNPLKLIDLDGLIEKAIYDNLVNWLKGFLGWANYYQAVQMANDAIKQLDAIASTVNCGDPQVVSVCFIPGPPALRYSLTVAKGEAFILPPKVCTTFEICGTKDCECIDLNDPRALDPKLRKAM